MLFMDQWKKILCNLPKAPAMYDKGDRSRKTINKASHVIGFAYLLKLKCCLVREQLV